MKNLLIITTLLFLFSCKEKNENTVVASENANVVSSVESKSSARYKKGNSLIDAIYFEMIKKDEALKLLDDEINSIKKNSIELIIQKEELLYKPHEYYSDVDRKIAVVNDSVLKKEMQNFIKSSSDNFKKKKKDLELIIKQIESNNRKINDRYDFYKIKKTLPEIEKYQNQNPVKLEELYKIISDQNELLEKLKNLK